MFILSQLSYDHLSECMIIVDGMMEIIKTVSNFNELEFPPIAHSIFLVVIEC